MIDRLTLTEKKLAETARGMVEVAQLPILSARSSGMWKRPNGMDVGRMRVPIGVIAIIYESRPNVTADATSLCLKTGNCRNPAGWFRGHKHKQDNGQDYEGSRQERRSARRRHNLY